MLGVSMERLEEIHNVSSESYDSRLHVMYNIMWHIKLLDYRPLSFYMQSFIVAPLVLASAFWNLALFVNN